MKQFFENDVGIRFVRHQLLNGIQSLYKIPGRDLLFTVYAIVLPLVLMTASGYLILEIIGTAMIIALLGGQILDVAGLLKPKDRK